MTTTPDFLTRVRALPHLGIGVSTEHGARRAGGLDPRALRAQHAGYAQFLEVGVETDKGLDDDTRAWAEAGWPTTYHFLDVNLDEDEDFDALWLDDVRALVTQLRPAWLCGDAGLWHFGPRDRAHMLLLPPVLTDESAAELARGVVRLREALGLEVLPENPPGTAFVGDLHPLEFFARVVTRADTGILLDVAHLALAQRVLGCDPLFGLDAFPLERVVDLHVAGGVERNTHGFSWVEDTHTPHVLDDTWRIFEHVVARAPNLKAVIFECERNGIDDVTAGFARIERTLGPAWRART
jgi:uncharacterized protein (UPF0276 family)